MKSVPCATALAVASILLGIVACRTSTPEQSNGIDLSTIGLPALDMIPDGQRDALRDGQVTRQEYADAFTAFQQCVEVAGGLLIVTSRSPVTGEITYGTGHELGTPSVPKLESPEGRCYNDQFGWVEIAFSRSPAVVEQALADARQLYLSETRPCLIANGVDAPANIDFNSLDYGALVRQYITFRTSGLCE